MSYDEYKLAKKRLSYFANNVLVTPDVNRQLKIENANIIKEADKELIEKYGLHNAINSLSTSFPSRLLIKLSILSIGPGLYKAKAVAISSNDLTLSLDKNLFIPVDSN